ncbi:uncharacterized protein LOC121366554 [Gigantopelta aegis]|uniref:uncharacterized protein LOC121366554 n=1 Tax=Gigantopelta aegis TaxID=1735272 RepID=UPI001B88D22C|nr:uncharacterized protein LOC121366554 [Gigantopelta aegis]
MSMQKYCEIHKDEKLGFYCEACNKVICRDCKLTYHEGHKTKDITDVAEKARTSLAKKKVELETITETTKQSIDHIDCDNNTETSEDINHVIEEINKLVDSLTDTINTERRKWKDKVRDIRESYGKKCSVEKYRLKQRQRFLQSQIDHTDAMLKDGLDCDVLTADREIKQRLAEIKKDKQFDSDFKSLKSDITNLTTSVLDVVRCAVRNARRHAFPFACEPEPLEWIKSYQYIDYYMPLYSITFTKTQNVLISYCTKGNKFLGLFKNTSQKQTKIGIDLDELRNEGIHGVIEKHNKENPDNKIPADDYTDLKKSFPYKDTNDNGDMCHVLKEHNWVGIQTVSGEVRTLTFNPFAEPGQEFRPVDVCWGNNQEIYIVDSGSGVIVVYSLQHGFQKSLTTPYIFTLITAVEVNTDGKLWVGDSCGKITVYSID